jgi:PD-(D/E)XK nuclease superfamily
MSRFTRWSNSSLTTLQMCAHKFYLKHIMKDYRQAGYQAKRGLAVHHVAKEAHKRQMIELKLWGPEDGVSQITEMPGSPKSVEEAKDIAATQFDKAVAQGVIMSAKDKAEYTEDQLKADCKDTAVALSALYVQDVAPGIKPVAVERKVEIRPKDMDITIMGYIDLVEDDLGDVIRDLKTAEKAPFKDAAKYSQQLTMYNMIRAAETRKMPRESRLVHLVRTPKSHETSVVVQSTTRDIEDLKRLRERLSTAIDAVDKGVFVPADQSAPGSPCNWCEFRDGTCKYVKKQEV